MLVTIDFETYYGKDLSLRTVSTPEYVGSPLFKVHMMGIKVNNEQPVIIAPENIQATLDHLTSLDEEIHLICQNVLFDGYILSHCYNWFPDKYIDTAAMSRGLNPHASASLAKISERLFPNDPAKQKGKELAKSYGVRDLNATPGLFNSIANYCLKDVVITYIAYQNYLTKLPQDEIDLIHVISAMFCDPIFDLDLDLLRKHALFLDGQRAKIIKASNLPETVLASNPQYADAIKNLGLTPPEKISPTTGKRTFAFAKTDLAYIKFQKDNSQHQNIWDARQAAKSTLNITRVKRFITIGELANGKMPAALKYSAAHTHRLGGSDKTNLQNLPRNAREPHPDGDMRPGVLRRALRAPDTMTILVRDLSNIEARILAVLADQFDLIDIFKANGDPYAAMASHIYGRTINKKTDPLERNVGKVAVLGLGYGMSGAKFKDTLNSGPLGMPPIFLPNITDYDRIVYNVYRKINTGITNFWKTCDRFIYWMATAADGEVLDYKCLKVYRNKILLPNGLYLHYPKMQQFQGGWGYESKNGVVSIYGGKLTENIIQALAQIVIKTVMLETTRQLPEWRVALQVHDETINIGPENDAPRADKIIEKIMGTPPTWMPDLPLNSEGGWAKNYTK